MGNAEASDGLVTYLRSTPLKLKHINISGGDMEWLVHFRQCETVHLTCFGEVLEDVLLKEHDLLDPRAQRPSELQSLRLDLRHPKDYFDPYIFIDFIKRQINVSQPRFRYPALVCIRTPRDVGSQRFWEGRMY